VRQIAQLRGGDETLILLILAATSSKHFLMASRWLAPQKGLQPTPQHHTQTRMVVTITDNTLAAREATTAEPSDPQHVSRGLVAALRHARPVCGCGPPTRFGRSAAILHIKASDRKLLGPLLASRLSPAMHVPAVSVPAVDAVVSPLPRRQSVSTLPCNLTRADDLLAHKHAAGVLLGTRPVWGGSTWPLESSLGSDRPRPRRGAVRSSRCCFGSHLARCQAASPPPGPDTPFRRSRPRLHVQ